MEFRKAKLSDLSGILSLFKKATQNMIDQGVRQWDDVYPNKEILQSDIENEHMYLYMRGNQIAAVFVINQECDPEYADGNWRYPLCSFAVIHRLCVSPVFQNQGIGTRAVLAAESLIKHMKIECIRLDAYSKNPFALKLYEKLGYTKVGAVTFKKVCFLFEKML